MSKAFLCGLLWFACSASAQVDPSVVAKLREGGLVLYMRHTSTDFSQNDAAMTSYADCAHQRNLTEKGRAEAREIGLKRIFCLTYKPDFFAKHGFHLVDKSELPHKVWGDCIKCVKFPDCDENAMILDL